MNRKDRRQKGRNTRRHECVYIYIYMTTNFPNDITYIIIVVCMPRHVNQRSKLEIFPRQ